MATRSPRSSKRTTTPAPSRRKPETIESDRKIIQTYQEHPDWSSDEIAKIIGVSKQTVYAALNRNGIKTRRAQAVIATVSASEAEQALKDFLEIAQAHRDGEVTDAFYARRLASALDRWSPPSGES